MPERPRNLFEVLFRAGGEALGAVPEYKQRMFQRKGFTEQMQLRREERELAKEKFALTKDEFRQRKAMDEIAAQLDAQQQKDLEDYRNEQIEIQNKKLGLLNTLGGNAQLLEYYKQVGDTANYDALSRKLSYVKPEGDSQAETKKLIDKLVGARGAKTRTIGGKTETITPGTGFLGTGLFARPDTTVTETPKRQIPIGVQELQAFKDSLNKAFGIDTTITQKSKYSLDMLREDFEAGKIDEKTYNKWRLNPDVR